MADRARARFRADQLHDAQAGFHVETPRRGTFAAPRQAPAPQDRVLLRRRPERNAGRIVRLTPPRVDRSNHRSGWIAENLHLLEVRDEEPGALFVERFPSRATRNRDLLD